MFHCVGAVLSFAQLQLLYEFFGHRQFLRPNLLAAGAEARVIGHWLFPWFAWGAAILAAAGFGWWIFTENRTRRALTSAEADRAALEETAAHVVREIAATKAPGADTVSLNLGSLGRAMDRKHKRTIKRLRAGRARQRMNFPAGNPALSSGRVIPREW